MTKNNSQRLNRIEASLAPADWARRLAGEMNKHPSEIEFQRAIARKSYLESPYAKPRIALARQAEQRYPGTSVRAIKARNQFHRNLLAEYEFFKTLLCETRAAYRQGAETDRLRVQVRALSFQVLAGMEEFAPFAKILSEDRRLSPDSEQSFNLPLLEKMQRSRLLLRIWHWIRDTEMVLLEIAANQTAIKRLQEMHFGGDQILNQDDEEELEKRVQSIVDLISEFDEWWNASDNVFKQILESKGCQEDKVEGDAFIAPIPLIPIINVKFIMTCARETFADYIITEWVADAQHEAQAVYLSDELERNNCRWEHFQKNFRGVARV